MSAPALPLSNNKTTHYKKHYRIVFFAALLSMIGPFSIDTYLPSFPDIESSFAISRATLSQSMGIYLLAFALSTLFWGPLSDRIGRRWVILASLLIYALGSIGCAMTEDYTFFILMRLLQGVSASGGFIAGRAMIRDAHDAASAHKAMTQVTLVFALAPAIAPLLGGWLHQLFGWRSIFWFLMAFGLLLSVLTPFVKETLAHEHRQSFHPRSVLRVYINILANKKFVTLALSLTLSFSGLFLYIAGAPTVVYDFLGLGSGDFGLQFIPMVAGMMLGSFLSGHLAHRIDIRKTAAIGFIIMFLSIIANLLQAQLLIPRVVTVIAPMVLYSFGLSITMPAITILSLDCFPKHRGAAASMQGFLQMAFNAGVASIAVPLLHSQLIHFVLGQGLLLLSALFLWFYYRYLMRGEI